MPTVTYRDLTTLDEFAAVVDLERRIWGPGYDEVVPVPILTVTVHRGGILIGAFDGERMIGFVYSLPGIKHGRTTQWSHMLGVVDEFRNDGVGHRLKLLQRDRALAMGLDVIEWTYDPMQAMNAHLNFAKLGVVVDEYEVNIYGESTSPLHRGNPTDRFVAQWNIRDPHVERRLNARPGAPQGSASAARDSGPQIPLRADDVGDAAHLNRAAPAGEWLDCVDVRLGLGARRLLVEIPMGFNEMLSRAPDRALAWRMATREIFTCYFARGYRAIEFFLDRPSRKGAYLLVRKSA
jgi:predicted GNAT superfamily acetyltransferase